MSKKMVVAVSMALSLSAGSALAQEKAESTSVTCDDLNWSAEVLAQNPNVPQYCRAVYEKDGQLYAKAKAQVVRVRGNRITFRPVFADGSLDDSRSIQVGSDWRANIGGRQYRASDLMRGQELNIYVPQDRFALAIEDETSVGLADETVHEVEEEVVEMPTTASPLFLVGAVGGAFLALGGLLSGLRRRLS